MSAPALPIPRRAWLAVIALLHAATFLCWRVAPYQPPPAGAPRESELVYLQTPRALARPAAAPAPATAARPTSRPRAVPPPPMASLPDAPAASAGTPPVAEAVTVPAAPGHAADLFAQPSRAPGSTLERARLAAAGVDRQLRKESLNKFATIVQPDTKLGMAIARAQTKDWVLEQVSDQGDGVIMKRYRKGNQEYCEYTNLVGARGQDPGRDWNKTKVMTCP